MMKCNRVLSFVCSMLAGVLQLVLDHVPQSVIELNIYSYRLLPLLQLST